MPETASQDATLLGQSVSYEVRQSSEATQPRIDVDIRGIQVIIPESSGVDPETVLTENAAWVIEKKRKYEDYREQIPDRDFTAGEMFPFHGEPHAVVVEQRSTSQVEEGALRLAKHHVNQTSIQRGLEALYRREARKYFETRAEELAEEMDVEYEQIEVRNQRTKWGSCSTSGTLSLNWRLMMAPTSVIDSILIHELTHLREQNHSDAFWSIVAEYDPDYQDHHQWLEEHSPRLVFSDDDL